MPCCVLLLFRGDIAFVHYVISGCVVGHPVLANAGRVDLQPAWASFGSRQLTDKLMSLLQLVSCRDFGYVVGHMFCRQGMCAGQRSNGVRDFLTTLLSSVAVSEVSRP